MKKRFSLFLAGLLAVCLIPGCKSSKTPPTTVQLKITAEDQVEFEVIKLGVRSINEDPVTGFSQHEGAEIFIEGRDLSEDPFLLELSPSATMATQVAICARGELGVSGSGAVMSGVAIATFVPGAATPVTIIMRNTSNFPDRDNDCFTALDPNETLRDCDDNDAKRNPFVIDICGNRTDDNCNGSVDEGCACNEGDVKPCYDMSDINTLASVGKGECHYGLQHCDRNHVWGKCEGYTLPTENEDCGPDGYGNGLDDNCNGSVDEGCLCHEGESRYCFNSAVVNINEADPLDKLTFTEETANGTVVRKANSLTGSGYCAARTQHCELSGGSWKWNRCGGTNNTDKHILPNRVFTEDGIPVYVESECDGIDEDCDGMTDENSEYAYVNVPLFDKDNDGYTICGTRHDGVPGTSEYMIDCNDDPETGFNIHPNAIEICENNIDENCLFDWGENIGKPNLEHYNGPEADLVCSQQSNPADLTCETSKSYFFGYVTQENTWPYLACHYNNDVYWAHCEAGRCLDENSCLINTPTQGSIAAERPRCADKVPDTCMGTIGPQWQPIPFDEDKYNDCGSFDCDCSEATEGDGCLIHYFGIRGPVGATCPNDRLFLRTDNTLDPNRFCNTCYKNKDVAAHSAANSLSNACDGSSECLNERKCSEQGYSVLPAKCQMLSQAETDNEQCTGTNAPVFVNAPFGSDPFNQCSTTTINCSDRFLGWNGNVCNKAGSRYKGLCSGNGNCITSDILIDEICQNKDFLNSDMDSIQAHISCGSEACRKESSCRIGEKIESNSLSDFCYTDGVTQGNCPTNQVCNATGKCAKINGQSCNASTECNSGNCIDGVCCSSGSCDTCMACNIEGHEGSCYNVAGGQKDDTCQDNDKQCNGKGECLSIDGIGCRNDYDCLNGFCKDGFCCNNECSGSCMACNIPGQEGICSYVTNAYDNDTCTAGGKGCKGSKCKCDESHECKAEQGTQCNSNDNDCITGNCVDGYCCDTSCNNPCESCSLNGTFGTCTEVPTGDNDDNCPAWKQCDGSNSKQVLKQSCSTGKVCEFKPQTTCKNGYCAEDADIHTASCPNSCVHDWDCDEGHYCDNSNPADKKCVPVLDKGLACGISTDNPENHNTCSTNHCIDGYCCGADSNSCGECEACNITGYLGTCTNIAAGLSDNDTCNGLNQVCNGEGKCVLKLGQSCLDINGQPDNTKCLNDNFCVDGVCCQKSTCGTCEACNMAGFEGFCSYVSAGETDEGSCEAPYQCYAGGKCALPKGQSCTKNEQCDSKYCVDGVCCTARSCGQCQECNIAGHLGECYNVAFGVQDDDSCNASNQQCDGQGTCRNINGTTCQTGSTCISEHCINSVCCEDAKCDEPTCIGNTKTTYSCKTPTAGKCEGTSSPCGGNLKCNSDQKNCLQICTKNDDCVSGYCNNNGKCVTKLDNGKECKPSDLKLAADGVDSLCTSGHCADGYCCNTSCDDTCKSCNITGHIGTCYNVAFGEKDNTSCNDANKICDGNGHCMTDSGKTCSKDSDCITNHCVDNVCCDTACNGTCKACNVSGHVGTCFNVPENATDDTCKTGNKVCNGQGDCLLPLGKSCSDGGQCISGNCVDGVCCGVDTCAICQECNSRGICENVAAGQQDNDSCHGPGQQCNGESGLNSCLLVNGTHCNNNSDCESGFCVDNVCCNNACTTADKCYNNSAYEYRCDLDNHLGECTANITACGEYACNPTSKKCNNACSAAGGCKADSYCSNGSCVAKLHDGDSGCTANNQCEGGFCTVAGKCSTACGICESGTKDASTKCQYVTANTACGTGSDFACNANGACLKKNGVMATNNSDCLSNILSADGYCCAGSCTGDCETCATGTCAPVTTETQTSRCKDTHVCVTSNNTSTCKKVNGQTCTAAADCASNYCIKGSGSTSYCMPNDCSDFICSGNSLTSYVGSSSGICQAVTTDCPDHYTCSSATSCNQTCTDDSACASGYYCNSSQCKTKLADNTSCLEHSQCASGNCSATFNSGSGGTKYCAPAGKCYYSPGNYVAINTGKCSADGSTYYTCQAGGVWSQASKPETTACNYSDMGPATGYQEYTCSDDHGFTAGTCTSCNGYLFNSTDKACNTAGTCQSHSDCAYGYFCADNGNCTALLADGQDCSENYQCVHGYCNTESKCDTSCGGDSGCTIGTAYMPGKKCTFAEPLTSCGTNKVCSSQGTCRDQNGTACEQPDTCASGICASGFCCSSSCNTGTSCSNGTLQETSCATGTCITTSTISCAPYAKCATDNTDECATTCQTNTDCTSGYKCREGHCVAPKLEVGKACLTDGDCASGNCTDGVCCSSSCTDVCSGSSITHKYCSLGSSECHSGTAAACPGGNVCASDHIHCATDCSNTTCQSGYICNSDTHKCEAKKANGVACTKADGSECANGNCVDSVCCENSCATPDSCAAENGTYYTTTYSCSSPVPGTCTPTKFSCGVYTCNQDGTACLTTCSTDSDCLGNYFCNDSGRCQAKKTNGLACTKADGSECANGNCVDSVCCEDSCATPDSCAAEDGTYYTTTYSCSSQTPGTCSSTKASCGAYKCNQDGTACLTTCSTDSDCLGNYFCNTSNNQCEAKKANGISCSGNDNECISGHCVGDDDNKICCDTACDTGISCSQAGGGYRSTSYSCTGTPKGSCQATVTLCGLYQCDSSSHECLSSCTSNENCIAGYYCNPLTNACIQKIAENQTCHPIKDVNVCQDGLACIAFICQPDNSSDSGDNSTPGKNN